MSRRLTVTMDEPTDAILERVAPAGDKSAYIRTAIAEKAARDEQRDENAALAELRARVERVERALGIGPPGPPADIT